MKGARHVAELRAKRLGALNRVVRRTPPHVAVVVSVRSSSGRVDNGGVEQFIAPTIRHQKVADPVRHETPAAGGTRGTAIASERVHAVFAIEEQQPWLFPTFNRTTS
jgi:hypothetical protein